MSEALLRFLAWVGGKLSHWLAFKLFDATVEPFFGFAVRWWRARVTKAAQTMKVPA